MEKATERLKMLTKAMIPHHCGRPLLASLILISLMLLGALPSYAQSEPQGQTESLSESQPESSVPSMNEPLALLANELFNAAVASPTHISPLDNAVTTAVSDPPVGVPTLTWSAVTGATRYHVQISASDGFASTIVNQNTDATTLTYNEVLADGIYFWRVRAEVNKEWGNFSAPWSFTKDWSAGGIVKPELISPADDPAGQAVTTNFSPEHFSWSPVSGAAAYILEISVSPTFNDPKPYRVTTLKTNHTPTTQFANNQYFWRVIPIDFRDHAGEPSLVRTFTFGWNQIPNLLQPDDDLLARFVPRFTWEAVAGASSYILEVSSQEGFSSLVATVATKNASYTPEVSFANDKEYFWRVRAVSPLNVSGPPSAVRSFHTSWVEPPALLSPPPFSIQHIYPYFSWTPVAGAQKYHIQVSDSNTFADKLEDTILVNATSFTKPGWDEVNFGNNVFWRVRAMDANDNYTDWSDVAFFKFVTDAPPNLIYPEPYYEPDADGMPIHTNRTIANPLFVWDTTHEWLDGDAHIMEVPDSYLLEVAADQLFQDVRFSVLTAGQAAAPTTANPFNNLTQQQKYYWRVTPILNNVAMANGTIWETRIDPTVNQLPLDSNSQPDLLHPKDGFIAVGAAPVLGWLPVANAHHYEVQISQRRDFGDLADSSVSDTVDAYFANYVPWQGRQEAIPPAAYWWRVRAKNSGNAPLGDWSSARRFMLMNPLMTGNQTDYPLPETGTIVAAAAGYDPAFCQIAINSSPAASPYALGALNIVQDRSIKRTQESFDLNWVLAFGVSTNLVGNVSYAIYFDVNQLENVGGTSDPRGNAITTDPLYRPDYVIYVNRSNDTVAANTTSLYRWNGSGWEGPYLLGNLDGEIIYDAGQATIQLLFPYGTIIRDESDQFSGALAVAAYSFGASTTVQDVVPHQHGSVLEKPALVTDMPTPLYPFDTPLTNPIIFHELPSQRWRMPHQNFPDGYVIEVARHADFTDESIINSWESYEEEFSPMYGPIPTAFHADIAYNDDESYYWRVRYRHEEYNDDGDYDYGPWSQPMRFKLTSYVPGNPTVTLGNMQTGEAAYATPSFMWDRVEGAARYSIQIDNDFNLNSPIVNKNIDGNSYTALETLADGTYYWRVAMRRTNNVLGQWTSIMSFTKTSLVPTLVSPINSAVINHQPTFVWAAAISNTGELHIAAPRYRLQWDDNPQFNSPASVETEATSYTPVKGQSLNDGTWYWRVAVIDGNGKLGPDSAVAIFYKEYLRPELQAPVQGSGGSADITFEWAPLDGAAYYKLEIDDNEAFDSPIRVSTDNTRYTHIANFPEGQYYWRVQMVDKDNKPGPTISSSFTQGPDATPVIYMPLVRAPN